ELVSIVLELLELFDDGARLRRVAIEIEAELLRLHEQAAASCHVGYKHALLVADLRRIDVLVAVADLLRGVRVRAALVGEGRKPDEWRLRVVLEIREVRHE